MIIRIGNVRFRVHEWPLPVSRNEYVMSTMMVENYLRIDQDAARDLLSAALDGPDERQQMLDRLGFEAAAAADEVAARIGLASSFYDGELQGSDFTLWRKFLPSTRQITTYKFDVPPLEALDAIGFATEVGCFDHIEIWTPEGNTLAGRFSRLSDGVADLLEELKDMTDPMAIGVIRDAAGDEHYFPIVRWGESLVSLAAIEKFVARVDFQVMLSSVVAPAALMTAIAVLAVMAFVNGIAGTLALGAFGGLLGVFFLVWIVGRWAGRRMMVAERQALAQPKHEGFVRSVKAAAERRANQSM